LAKGNNHGYMPDEIDRKIIQILTVDGRTPYRDLGQRVSLSETRVRFRVLRLIEEGFIHIVGIPNLVKLDDNQMAMLGIQVSGNIEEVADILAQYEYITFLTICAGTYDIMIEVAYRSPNDLLQMIQQIRSLPGVKNTDSFVYLKTPKTLYSANPGIMQYSSIEG